MVEPDKKDLEDTVRNLREENAKLLQLLRSQGLLVDAPPINQNGKSTDSISLSPPPSDTTNITFDHSDLTLTTNSINTTNQTHHQHINNHGTTNQQNYNEQTIHGNQSNITPNFNTVIQSTAQPFVQNNSNTLVQNNTNLIQPINLVNFNNVSIDSIQSFFASQNNVVYLPQTTSSSSSTTTTTTTTTSANSSINELLTSNTHSILPPPSTSSSSSSVLTDHQISIRPKPSLIHQHQELVPVIPKIKTEHYESITRQSSSSITSNNDTTNLLDNDSNDSKKYPRPIRPRPSSKAHSLQTYKSVAVNEPKSISSTSSSFINNNNNINNNNSSPTISLFSSPTYSSSPSSIDHHHHHPLIHSKSLDLSNSSTNNILPPPPITTTNKKSNKSRPRNRKKPATSTSSSSSVIVPPTNNSILVPIAPNIGRPLAPAPLNSQRIVTANNPITKRSTTNKKSTKRNSKTLVQYHSESILQQNSSSPNNSFAESISGLLENFDQELIASNFLSQATTNNLLSDENNTIISSNTNIISTTIENLDHGAIQNQESYHTTTSSMPTLDEFTNRLEHETILPNQTTQDFNVETEQITSFMNEEDMRLVEMNFDENTFLKQFDLEDPGIKLSVHSDQNLFANILTNNNDLIQIQQSTTHQNLSHSLPSVPPSAPAPPPPPPPPPSSYPGSSLINNNVFTTVVPLGLRQQTSQTNTFISNINATRLLPEEGVQLTARHIEPSQVATYESVKYQDILDDLVMVTDQDALRHAQVAAADGDPTDVSTDFSFALLEATNEIMKNTHIEIVGENCSAFTELQYFYPIEQEQEILQKQLENCQTKQQDILDDQQPIVILEKLQSQIIVSNDLNKNLLNDSVINSTITDLSSILQFQSVQSPVQHDNNTSITELITPIRSTKINPSSSSSSLLTRSKSPEHQIDYDSLLPPLNNDTTLAYSPISDTLALSSNSIQQQNQSKESSSKACILFEPISSSSNPPSPTTANSSNNEMIIDSGRLEDLSRENSNIINNDDEIEELLRDTTNTQFEIVENQGQTFINNPLTINNVDELIEQIEPIEISPKRHQLLEHTFSRYQEKYQLNLQRQQDITTKESQEQLLTIPPVKLKLTSIYSQQQQQPPKKKKKRKSISASSSPSKELVIDDTPAKQLTNEPPPKQPTNDQPTTERPPLKITIRTKLPPPPPPPTTTITTSSSEEKTSNKKIRKNKKKKSHHHHHHHHHQKKTKTIADQLETEYAGLTRFERPLAQLYRQQSPPTPDETLMKDESHSSPISAPVSQSSTTFHSGFIIDEQTPPSSITSMEQKPSSPPLLLSQTTARNDALKLNYSHLFNYDSNQEHQNNNTFITPPPEIDLNPQQQKSSPYENFCSFSNSPNKKKHHQRKSSVTSSSSSKSLTNTDYAIDTQALEPVSPTPISTSKQKHSQNQSSSSSSSAATGAIGAGGGNYNDISPPYFDHQQQKQMKDYYSKKSSSSSNRSSRPTTSQMYPQPRSLSNHNYRTSQDPSLIPPILPPPPPPIHLDPYSQSYHHPFVPRAAPPPFFNFPFPHPFLNPHSTTTPSHFHHHQMKYPHHPPHHHHPSHGYPTHQQQYSYHPHLQRQQQYNNSNYMSSRDHHSFDR